MNRLPNKGLKIIKHIIFIGLVLGFVTSVQAQWTDNGNSITTGDKVGIGTTSPNFQTHLHYDDDYTGDSFYENKHGLYVSNMSNVVGSYSALSLGRQDAWSIRSVFNANNDFDLQFVQWFTWANSDIVRVHFDNNGKVGIGTTNPAKKLTVNGTAKAQEVIVEENVGADFVFEEDYPLPRLSQIEQFVNKHKHLPEIPSAEEMKRNGVKIGDLQMKLLQKIEELTLYTIEQEKKMEKMRTEFRKKMHQQQQEIEQLKQLINSY